MNFKFIPKQRKETYDKQNTFVRISKGKILLTRSVVTGLGIKKSDKWVIALDKEDPNRRYLYVLRTNNGYAKAGSRTLSMGKTSGFIRCPEIFEELLIPENRYMFTPFNNEKFNGLMIDLKTPVSGPAEVYDQTN